MQFAGGQPVHRAHHAAQKARRPGVPTQTVGERAGARIERFDGGDIVGEHRRQLGFGEQAPDAADRLAGLQRLFPREIVAPDAGVAVEQQERPLLGLEVGNDATEHDVFEDVGEIAGVIGMAVIHGAAT